MGKPLHKAQMEKMCRDAGMVPVKRTTIQGRQIFVADGFSKVPHFTYQKFGVEVDDFTDGAYCTLWFSTVGEDTLDIGLPMFFEKDHDPQLMGSAKQHARINTALKECQTTLGECEKVRGMNLNA